MPNFLFQTVVGADRFTVDVEADTQDEAAVLAANEFQPSFGDVEVTLVSSDAPSAPATPPAAPAAPTPDSAPAPDAPAPDAAPTSPADTSAGGSTSPAASAPAGG